MLTPSQQGQAALDALETDWADKQTMLKMPEGKQKIDYHLLTGQHIVEVCDVEFVGTKTPPGCEVAGTLQIATGDLPQQHELMHAYLELVAPGALPIRSSWREPPKRSAATPKPAPIYVRRPLAAGGRGGRQGDARGRLRRRRLVRALLDSTEGIDAFVRYYGRRRDAAIRRCSPRIFLLSGA